MSYRDDHEATVARNDALEAELADARRKLAVFERGGQVQPDPDERAIGRIAIGVAIAFLLIALLCAAVQL